MTEQQNQIRPNVFAFDHYPQSVDWSKYQVGPGGAFANAFYNGYPGQQNVSSPTSGFPFYASFPNQQNSVYQFENVNNKGVGASSSTINISPPFFLNSRSGEKQEGLNDFQAITNHTPFRCKRKTDSPPPFAPKQHITEEKMALHMSQLHISSETVQGPMKSDQEPSESKQKRLYMCEEMRKLQTDSILPQSIINRITRPCTALVLWTPPSKPFPLPNTEPIDENDNNNNNNNTVLENNNSELVDNIEIEIEDIENEIDMDSR